MRDDEIQAALGGLDGWSGGPDGITRTAELAGFPMAIEVVDQVAVIAEELDHHPDIDIRYNKVSFTCATHSEGGVTDKDIDLARRIDAVISEA